MNEFRNVLACLDNVMRKELLEDVEERLDAVAVFAFSWSCADEVDKLELDWLGCDRWSTAELEELDDVTAR